MIAYVAKLAPILVIISLLCPIVSNYVMNQYDFIEDLSIEPIKVNGNGSNIKASATFDVYFTEDAWDVFQYKDGSFPYMSAWWEDHEGETFEYAGHSAKLLQIEWTQLEHHEDHDRLNVVVHIQLK